MDKRTIKLAGFIFFTPLSGGKVLNQDIKIAGIINPGIQAPSSINYAHHYYKAN